MIMNYNQWFHKFHKYLVGNRNGKASFNDTKWMTINKRYETLLDLDSQLIDKQPYGVVGNYTGFQKLFDLMEKSNYTFEDLNQSLIDTYQMSLQNAMSGMLVNTHAVVANVKYGDKKNISIDRYGDFIIDVPFDQLHFGDRDEFIRQKLPLMHHNPDGNYIPASDFLSDDISRMIGFTLICCVNGCMVRNWSVGINENGFRFKIPWKQTADPNFIIYKLDSSKVIEANSVGVSYIINKRVIPFSLFENAGSVSHWIGCKCIIGIVDPVYEKNVQIVPNFGYITANGLEIRNIQKKTLIDIERFNSKNVSIRAYILKYLYEVPNVYPAINYYDMMESRVVYDESYRHIANDDGNRVLLQHTEVVNDHDICTPPISIDRPSSISYRTLISGCRLQSTLQSLTDLIHKIGDSCNANPALFTNEYIQTNIYAPARYVIQTLGSGYQTYMECAVITSMISEEKIKRYQSLIEKFRRLTLADPSYSAIQNVVFDELYGEGYQLFMNDITSPFSKEPFTTLIKIVNNDPSYFTLEDGTRFNRPISEQCFIVLKYSHDIDSWVFDVPSIRHFNGIGNTFYVNQRLTGEEIYKFFFLYTDTANPSEPNVEPFDMDERMDFDLFMKQVDSHMGFVKYWNAENQLYKLSQMMYMKSDNTEQINVLSKMLQRKLDGELYLEYPSEMNYEPSNASSDNVAGGEYDERAPFALNFLFYTVNMLFGHEDQLLSYFIHMLIERNYHPRYADLHINEIDPSLSKELVNYSIINEAPVTLTPTDYQYCEFPDADGVTLYAGIPYPLQSNHSPVNMNYYRYTFNQYHETQQHPLILRDGIDNMHYIGYANLPIEIHQYFDDIKIANLVSMYLCDIYLYIGELETNFKSIWNQKPMIQSCMDRMRKRREQIVEYVTSRGDDFRPSYADTQNIVDDMQSDITEDPLYQNLETMYGYINDMHIWTNPLANKSFKLYGLVSAILMILQKVFDYTGFDQCGVQRIRRLYLQLKQLNESMSLQQLYQWANTLDLEILAMIPDLYPDNPNVLYAKSLFTTYHAHLQIFINRIITNVPLIQQCLDELESDVFPNHMQTYIDYCDAITQSYMFAMYALNDIDFTSFTTTTEPAYACITFSQSDTHTILPNTTNANDVIITLYPVYEKESATSYRVYKLIPICQYTFFDGTDVSTTVTFYDKNQSIIGTPQSVTLTFRKTSLSSDLMSDMNQFIGMQSLSIDVQNIHEKFHVDQDEIINESHADLHYELIAGNHFMPLSNFKEFPFATDNDMLPGPNDRVYIPCDQLNQFGIVDQSSRSQKTMFFQACQIMHMEPTDDVLTSIGGKYFVGQRLYAYTDDQLYLVPMIITSIDHSQSHGFIEAKVDMKHATWMKTTDETVMHRYLTSNITCTVCDDNIRNFMDEFSGYDMIPENLAQEMFDYHTHLTYLGYGHVLENDSKIIVNMIDHNFNPFTDPELYPILRTEPDDHSVWKEEIRVFKEEIAKANAKEQGIASTLQSIAIGIATAQTREEKIQLQIQYDSLASKLEYQEAYIRRLRYYIQQLETPTTWYNVGTYDAALVYINNGRAKISRTWRPNIRDLSYTDQTHIRLYDWESKSWIDLSEYTITSLIENDIHMNDDMTYDTDDVMTSLTIEFHDTSYASHKILIYLSYDSSNAFDDITMNPMTCDVRFRPVLICNDMRNQNDLYSDISIRKHYDANERYTVRQLNPVPEDFPYQNGIMLERYSRSGTYTNGSLLRFCDFKCYSVNNEYDYTDFDVYVKNPMQDASISQYRINQSYQTNIIQQTNGFRIGDVITLMCVENKYDRSFNGNISDILFTAKTSGDNQITIIQSTAPKVVGNQSYLCTVVPDSTHPMIGGLITVNVHTSQTLISDVVDWVKLGQDIAYRIIPDCVILVPHEPITISDAATIELKNHYALDTDATISVDNSNIDDVFTYYYDKTNHVRYPIANIRKQQIDERFVINRALNPDINTIRSNYISISRYVSQRIPQDGIIDLNGKIPTPLSRDRYEFWVNGRYISDPSQLIILSPTMFQLRNMTSLRNLEVIELVDDTQISSITPIGTHYIDLNGNVYGSYQIASMKNVNVTNESIQFQFNQNVYQQLDSYLPDGIRASNNVDVEPDILDYVISNESPTAYDELYHFPTINGVELHHNTSQSLGFMEIQKEDILKQFDKTWKLERFNGVVPSIQDYAKLRKSETKQVLHVQIIDGSRFEVFATGTDRSVYTLYISNLQNGIIDDPENTLQIIPMISQDVHIMLHSRYGGKWLHSTNPNTLPILIPWIEPQPDFGTSIYIRDYVTREIVAQFEYGLFAYTDARTWMRESSDPNALYEFVVVDAYSDFIESDNAGMMNQTNLKRFVIQTSNIHVISAAYFNGCTNLTDVVLTYGLREFRNAAFYGTAITNIHIPETVSIINSGTFYGANDLTTIVIDLQQDSIQGAPWGAQNPNIQVIWNG